MDEHFLDDAYDFLNIISLNGPLLREFSPESLIFRGQSEVVHDLIPRALRQPLPTMQEQLAFECEQLVIFLRTADLQGLPIQDDTPNMRYVLMNLHKRLRSENMKGCPDNWPSYTPFSSTTFA